MASYREHCARFHTAASLAGLTYDQAERLRRDAQRMHTISEQECNGTLWRVEEPFTDSRGRELKVGAVYQVTNIDGPGPMHYYRTPDRETGCRKRIDALAAEHGATVEYQGDPRGWPVTLKFADGRELCPPVRS